MNIKTKLILAATAVSLLSTPALAFRDMGDSGGDSAYAIPENHSNSGTYDSGSGYSRDPYSAYAFSPVARPRYFIQRRPAYQDYWSDGYQGWSGGHIDR
jgi:uncharacterized membrane protein